MRIHVVLPGIHGRLTGGNVYNTELMRALGARLTVFEHHENELSIEHLQRSVRPGDAVLVDSLLVHDDRVRRLRNALTECRIVLLVHYLHLIDPRRRDSPTADRERQRLGDYHGFLATSRYSKDGLVRAGADRACVGVIYPGVKTGVRNEAPPAAASRGVRFLTVASLVPDKGHLDILHALEGCEDARWTWEVVGEEALDASFAQALRMRLGRSPVGERVRIRGALPALDVEALYGASDLLLLASAFESCSMVTMEALAAGLPVLAYDVGGLGEHVRRPAAARLVEAANRSALAGAVRDVLEHPDRLRAMKEAARLNGGFGTWADAADRMLGFVSGLPAGAR